jgi:hypothetical protein
MPTIGFKFRGLEALSQERAHHVVRERLHATIRMMDHEPLVSAEQLVGDYKGANSIIAGAASCVTDDVSVPFLQPCLAGRVRRLDRPPRVLSGNVPIDVELRRAGVAHLEPLGSGCRIREGEQRHDESYHDFTNDAGAQP